MNWHKLGLAAAGLAMAGCPQRPTERTPCYLAADADATAAYIRECGPFGNVLEDCPDEVVIPIEEAHERALEACP